MLTARERGERHGLRVVPSNPGPEFQPGPAVPRGWRQRFAELREKLAQRQRATFAQER